ncbi:MAG: peptidoglycan D,D-transpeptidase FtsI family protein, partial [Phycisphaerae bacterium]
MFRTRLQWLVVLLSGFTLLILARIFAIQVVYGASYETLADRLLTRPVQYLGAPRGAILDRHGRPLVSDVPAWDVTIDYRVLAGDSAYLRAQARLALRQGRFDSDAAIAGLSGREREQAVADRLRVEIAEMWQRLAELTKQSVSTLIERGAGIRERIERIRENVRRNTGTAHTLREERQFHAIIESIDEDAALQVRLELEGRYPWLAVTPSARRTVHDADTLTHLLGRVGPASRERIDADAMQGDELRELRLGDEVGISGVELLCEDRLRGVRGRRLVEFNRNVLEQDEPVRGRDVKLAVDLELQKAAYEALRETVEASEFPSGGAAVVIDVATRDVLALVNYPKYSLADFNRDYDKLRRDARWTPLRFRAVSGQYPPGSVCKVITLLGGMSEGIVSAKTRIHCNGYLLPNQPEMFRCWIFNRYPGVTHDQRGNPAGQDAEDAIRNSCNIYFYTVGQRLGPERLCDWFSKFGLGKLQGTGLLEESSANVPTADWLRRTQGREFQAADAWNFSIGQGEVTATPLQAANVAATIAGGRFEPVRLVLGEGGDLQLPRQASVEFDAAGLRVARSGMWRVVNERGGTADYAQLATPGHVLCGKTGSAQATPRAISRRFTIEWPDGKRETLVAVDADDALAMARAARPVGGGELKIVGSQTAERYPPWQVGEKLPSHAWFIGFTQDADTPRGDAP